MLSTKTHICKCGCVLARYENAARNILCRGLGTIGHTETSGLNLGNACGETISTEEERNPASANRLNEPRIKRVFRLERIEKVCG
ncbi:hypothetical protein QUB47_30660 [Microcoleus sp. AT9_B5]